MSRESEEFWKNTYLNRLKTIWSVEENLVKREIDDEREIKGRDRFTASRLFQVPDDDAGLYF